MTIEHKREGETWRFTAQPGRAQRVYLVIDGITTASRWIEMQPTADHHGRWDVTTFLPPGNYRFRYYIANEGAYLNFGTSGLQGERLSGPHPRVHIEHFSRQAIPA